MQKSCLLNTMEVGTNWTCKCQVDSVGKSVLPHLSQQSVECRNADLTVTTKTIRPVSIRLRGSFRRVKQSKQIPNNNGTAKLALELLEIPHIMQLERLCWK